MATSRMSPFKLPPIRYPFLPFQPHESTSPFSASTLVVGNFLKGKFPLKILSHLSWLHLHTNLCPQILPVQVAICKEEHLKTFYNIAYFRKRVGLKYFFLFARIEFCCIISHSFLFESPMSFCFRCTLWNKASENM